MTEDELLETWRAVLAPALGVAVLDHDEAQQLETKGALPDRYVILYLFRRAADTIAMAGPNLDRGWRMQTRSVGLARYECSTIRTDLEDALYRKAFPHTRGLVTRDVEADDPQSDGGRWSGFDSWLFFTGR